MKEPRRMRRCRIGVAAHPGVQADVVVVPAGREEDGVVGVPLCHLEAENVPVETEGPFDVCDLQVDVADARSGAYHAFSAFACLHTNSSSWRCFCPLFYFRPPKVLTIR